MQAIYIELVYTNDNFSNIGKCYKDRDNAVKRLRQLKAEHEPTVAQYDEDYLFIVYWRGKDRVEVDFETKALR